MKIEILEDMICRLEKALNTSKGGTLNVRINRAKKFRSILRELKDNKITRIDIQEKMAKAMGINKQAVNQRLSTAKFSVEQFKMLKEAIIEINYDFDIESKKEKERMIEAERKAEEERKANQEQKYYVISNITEPWAFKYIYVFKSEETGRVKIGIANDPDRRIKEIEGAAGFKKTQERSYFGPFFLARKIENSIHKNLVECKYAYEWFDIEFDKAVMATHYGINKFFGIKAMAEHNKRQQLENKDEN